jgi:gliding motility-associated lipoprotein GldH
VKSKSPDGYQHRDSNEIFLAEESGKWLGKKNNDNWNLEYYYKRKVRFPKAGKYSFEIQHGMRDLEVAGIEKVVFELEKNID